MIRFCGLLGVLAIFLGGCTHMKPEDFRDAEPRLRVEEFFLGRTVASGIFEDRFANLRRQFVVTIDGRFDGPDFVLDERFEYSDGERQQRIWRIRKTGPNAYEGRADDVIGVATGTVYGNVLNWTYSIDLPIGGRTWQVAFDDWLYLLPMGVAINRAYVRKWGIDIGSVTIAFSK